MSVCLQAVETNLASKDSHWVFVNEVRRDAHRHSEHLTLDRVGQTGSLTVFSTTGELIEASLTPTVRNQMFRRFRKDI